MATVDSTIEPRSRPVVDREAPVGPKIVRVLAKAPIHIVLDR